MEQRCFTLRDYLTRCMDARRPDLTCTATTPEQFEAWRAEFTRRLDQALRPMPEPVDMNPETVLTVQLPGIRAEKIVFDSSRWMSVPAWILIPEAAAGGRRLPTVFVIAGHTGDIIEGASGKIVDETSGKAWAVGLNPDGSACDTRYHNDIAQTLARAGFVVYCQDFFGFGERASDPHYMRNQWTHICNNHAVALRMYADYDLTAVHRFDLHRGMEYLTSRPEVDVERIGMMGCSLGGMWTTFFTPLEPRIRAVAICCSYPNLRALLLKEKIGTCGAQALRGHGRLGRDSDFPAAIAPRPVMMQAARRDPGMTAEDVMQTTAEVEKIYAMLGCEDRFSVDIFDGEHEIHTPAAVEWFQRWLT